MILSFRELGLFLCMQFCIFIIQYFLYSEDIKFPNFSQFAWSDPSEGRLPCNPPLPLHPQRLQQWWWWWWAMMVVWSTMIGNDAGLWWWAMMGSLEVMYFLKHWQRQAGPEGLSLLILLSTLSQSTSFTIMVKFQIFCKEREIIMKTLTSQCNTFDKSMWQRFQFQQFITNLTNPTI